MSHSSESVYYSREERERDYKAKRTNRAYLCVLKY